MMLNTMLNAIRDYLYDGSEAAKFLPTHIALGTGTTAAAACDTALETEVYRDAISSSVKPAAKKVRHILSLSAGQGNGNTLTECGLITAATGGTLQNRIVHSPIIKTSSFELKYQIEIEVADA